MPKPEKVFKMGAIRASVFANAFTTEQGQTHSLRKVVLEVRYKGRDGQWRGTNSLSLNDLPKAIAALQQAYEYLLAQNSLDGYVGAARGVSASSAASASPKPTGPKRF